MRDLLRALLLMCLLMLGGKAAAQFPDIAGGFVDADLHAAVMRSVAEASAEQADVSTAPDLTPAQKDALQFTPSLVRRQQNYARFVEMTRAVDPEGAEKLQQDLSRNDVLAFAEGPFGALGFDMTNIADAYAAWLVTAWLAGAARSETPPPATMKAVRAQVARAFATLPQVLATGDAEKQQMAEAHYLQTILISVTVEAAQSDRAYLERVKAAVLTSAAGSGMDLQAFELTGTGFVVPQ